MSREELSGIKCYFLHNIALKLCQKKHKMRRMFDNDQAYYSSAEKLKIFDLTKNI